jgi:PAS domain S-box-containing protein
MLIERATAKTAIEKFDTPLALFDAMSSAVYTTDQNGLITYFNPAAARMWGREPDIGSAYWCGSFRMALPDGRPLAHEECPMAVCLKTGEGTCNREIIVERPDGVCRNILVSPQPLRDDAGCLIGAINTLTDITELRESERSRDVSTQLTEAILRNSQDCIKLLDIEGTVLSINPCGCSSLELDSETDALGMNYFEFWQHTDRDAALASAEAARKTGSGRFTADFVSRSGKSTTWDETLSLTTDGQGVPNGFLVISRDMSRELNEAREKKRQLEQQKALTEIGTLALSEISFQEFMDRTIARVAEVLDLPLAKILPYADQADHLWLAAGVGWHDGLVGHANVGVELASQAGYTLSVGGPVIVHDLQTETRFNGPPLLHDHGVRSGMSVTIPGTGARPFGVIGVHDIRLRQFDESQISFLVTVANLVASCHRQNEFAERQTLLVREIAHRSGNMLQFVTSIFNQTVRNSENLDDAKAKFGLRLHQMAKSNLLISNDGWSKTNFRDLAMQTLEPFRDRIDATGREVMLPAELCFDLGLVLHELATNSTKYGAFSGDHGKVSLDWKVETRDGRQDFVIMWSDQKALRCVEGHSTGFGTKLIHQLIQSKWAGRVTTELEPNYCCCISLPFPGQLADSSII